MREFGLTDAVASYSHYSSVIATLWGIYVAATFTAASFGAALEDRFTATLAVFLSAGFLAFTIGHAVLVVHAIRIQDVLRENITSFLRESPGPFAPAIESMCRYRSKPVPSLCAHFVIDACVLLIIWLTLTDRDPLNLF